MGKCIIRRRTVLLMLLFVSLGFFICYELYLPSKTETNFQKVPVAIQQLSDIKNVFKKILTKDAIINEIHQNQEIITTEVDISDDIILNNNWGTFDVFKKTQTLHFVGTGLYTVDLSNIKSEDITIDNNDKIISIIVSNPKVKGIILDEQKTGYEPVENGLFRFGDLKLLPEEYNIMVQEIKQKMLDKMNNPLFYKKATENSQTTIKEIIQLVVNAKTKEDYNVIVKMSEQ